MIGFLSRLFRSPNPVVGMMTYGSGRRCKIRWLMVFVCLDHVEKNCEFNGAECIEAYDWCVSEGLIIGGAPFRITDKGKAWMDEATRDHEIWRWTGDDEPMVRTDRHGNPVDLKGSNPA